MYQSKTCTTTDTQLLKYAKLKARKSLYLVLKKKPFATKIVEELNEEVERRLTIFIERLVKKMEGRKCDDPEKLLKYTILKAIVKILDNIMKENYIQMTEDDKIAVEKIFGDGNDDDDSPPSNYDAPKPPKPSNKSYGAKPNNYSYRHF